MHCLLDFDNNWQLNKYGINHAVLHDQIMLLYIIILSAIQPETLPNFINIGYLGSCYNILQGNPKVTAGEIDPGFQDGQNIYEFTYNERRTTTDGRYSIPDNTSVYDIQSCSFTFSSTTIKESSSYSSSLKVHVDADFSGWGASFSASSDYQKVKQTTSSGESMFISSEAECQAYGASIEDTQISKAFTDAVMHLPTASSSLDEYTEFLQVWGTHVVTSLIMGGRYGVRSELTTKNYSTLSSSQFNIKAAAGYSGFVSISASASTEQEKKVAEQFDESRQSYVIYQVGGKPPVDENGTTFEWAQTVKEMPLPLRYSLTEISKYFSSIYFPHDNNIDAKRALLLNAKDDYCKKTVPDPMMCQDISPHDSRIEVSIANENTYISEGSYSQYSENPSMRIIGALVGEGKADSQSVIMVDSQHASSNLITQSIGMQGTTDRQYLRYECPDGFNSVSDFFTNQLTPALPCINSTCLVQCSKIHWSEGNLNLIGSGFPELGNSGNQSLLSFFRDPVINLTNSKEEDLYKCLSYTCLSFQ